MFCCCFLGVCFCWGRGGGKSHHPKSKLNMFCVLSQYHQHFFAKITWTSFPFKSRLTENLSPSLSLNFYRLSSCLALVPNHIFHVLINNSRIAWSSKISLNILILFLLCFVLFLTIFFKMLNVVFHVNILNFGFSCSSSV